MTTKSKVKLIIMSTAQENIQVADLSRDSLYMEHHSLIFKWWKNSFIPKEFWILKGIISLREDSLKEDYKHFKHVACTFKYQRKFVLIEIKPLLNIKFIEVHLKEAKSINLIKIQINQPYQVQIGDRIRWVIYLFIL